MKYIQIAKQIKRQIEQGDYNFSELPGGPKLAKDTGCSYLTARQALQWLIDEKVLKRGENGRLEICKDKKSRREKLKIAYVKPSWDINRWDNVMFKTATKYNCMMRPVFFSHEDDPLIFDAIDGDFDFVFLSASRKDKLFLDKLKKSRNKVIMMCRDLSELGIRSIDGVGSEYIIELMRMLKNLGHESVDCFSSEPDNSAIVERIAEWLKIKEKLCISGQLITETVEFFSPTQYTAFKKMKKQLKSGYKPSSAVFCPAIGTAIGALRAFYESGIKVPEDVSLCSFGSPELSMLTIPSITIITTPDIQEVFDNLFKDLISGVQPDERLLYRSSGQILLGESTGPARKN